jgi:hypothetical protein
MTPPLHAMHKRLVALEQKFLQGGLFGKPRHADIGSDGEEESEDFDVHEFARYHGLRVYDPQEPDAPDDYNVHLTQFQTDEGDIPLETKVNIQYREWFTQVIWKIFQIKLLYHEPLFRIDTETTLPEELNARNYEQMKNVIDHTESLIKGWLAFQRHCSAVLMMENTKQINVQTDPANEQATKLIIAFKNDVGIVHIIFTKRMDTDGIWRDLHFEMGNPFNPNRYEWIIQPRTPMFNGNERRRVVPER